MTNNPDEACLFVVSYHPESKLNLQDLPYWKGDGRNHVIIDTSLVQTSPDKKIQEISSEKQFVLDNIGKAMIVSGDYFVKNNQTPRLGFDILVPKFRYNIVYGFCQKQTTRSVAKVFFLISGKNLVKSLSSLDRCCHLISFSKR